MNEMEVHTMKCPECGKEMRDGYLFCSIYCHAGGREHEAILSVEDWKTA